MDIKNKNKCYVFSYNRGIFLKNCVDSLEKYASKYFDLTIIDDFSDDEETKKLLKQYSKKYRIIYPPVKYKNRHTGNFYANMNYAFKDASKANAELILFIEDDMQIVREVHQEDISRINNFFEKNPKSVQLYINFFKKCNISYKKNIIFDEDSKVAYFRDDQHPLNSHYCSNGIFNSKRVSDFIGNLEDKLAVNEKKLKEKGCKMGFYMYPFMMWLPMLVSYRDKKTNRFHKIKEFFANAGYYPYDEMSQETQSKLLKHKAENIPYAEDYLKPEKVHKFKRWSFTGVDYAFRELGGWRIRVGRLLSFLEKKFFTK